MSKLKVGEVAPDFSLPKDNREVINLHSLKNKFVVLYFYPKDDTPGCTIEAHDFNRLKSEFEALDTLIIGISKDNLESHRKFKEKCALEFDLLSDTDDKVCEQYGVWMEKSMFGKKYMGIARTTFLIDQDKKIAHIWDNVNVNNHAAQVLNTVKSLS